MPSPDNQHSFGSAYLDRAGCLLRASLPQEVAVLSDFDGTISVRDVQVLLLDRFARPDWRDAERAVLRSGHKSFHYLPVNWDGCKAGLPEVLDYIDSYAAIDPAFPDFAASCNGRGWYMEVVSDGLSIYIERLLCRSGLDLPFYSNQIRFGVERTSLEFPNRNPICGKCGSCKRSRVAAARSRGVRCIVYAGDGISDECVADQVDLLFAKDSLESYCRKNGLPFVHFNDFADVGLCIDSLLGTSCQS